MPSSAKDWPETISGYDASEAVRHRAAELGFAAIAADAGGSAVEDADLVILCSPVGSYKRSRRTSRRI